MPHTHPASNEKSNSRSGILELEDRSSQMSEAPLSSKISIYLKDFTPILAQKIPQVVQIVLLSSFQLCPTSFHHRSQLHNQQLILKERNTSPKTHNNPPQPRQRLVRLTLIASPIHRFLHHV